MRGVFLERLSWPEAKAWFDKDPVVIIPIGAAAKEHGPHLPLNNDAVIAGWLAGQVMARLPVLVAPLINASFYPAFVDYPGSISLRAGTARDLVVESCGSLARHGGRRFYVINTGMSTRAPLAAAARRLGAGVSFDYLDPAAALAGLPPGLLTQSWGSHADEHETSLMLHIAPRLVDMARAVDDGAEGEGALSRERGRGTWSPSGVFGQATLASADKGRAVAQALLSRCLAQIEALA